MDKVACSSNVFMCTMAAVHQMMMCSFRRGQMNML